MVDDMAFLNGKVSLFAISRPIFRPNVNNCQKIDIDD